MTQLIQSGLPSAKQCKELLQVYRREHGLDVGACMRTRRLPYREYLSVYGVSAHFLEWVRASGEEDELREIVQQCSIPLTGPVATDHLDTLARYLGVNVHWCPTNLHVWEAIKTRYPSFCFEVMDDPKRFGIAGEVSFSNWPTDAQGHYLSMYALVTGLVQGTCSPLVQHHLRPPRSRRPRMLRWR